MKSISCEFFLCLFLCVRSICYCSEFIIWWLPCKIDGPLTEIFAIVNIFPVNALLFLCFRGYFISNVFKWLIVLNIMFLLHHNQLLMLTFFASRQSMQPNISIPLLTKTPIFHFQDFLAACILDQKFTCTSGLVVHIVGLALLTVAATLHRIIRHIMVQDALRFKM